MVEPPLRDVTTVDEDGHLALMGQFQLDGNYTNGVKEVLRIKLTTLCPTVFRLYDNTDADNPWTTIERDASGEYDAIQIDIQNPPALVMPENYHGEISYSFDLKSTAYTVDPIAGTTTPIFNAKSETDTITTTVVPQAEPAADQAVLSILIGDDAYRDAVDAEGAIEVNPNTGSLVDIPGIDGSIVPVVATEPNQNQTVWIALTGGDPSETHDVTISNIPGGMTVLVGDSATPAAVSFGVVTIEDVPLNQPLSLTLTASEALLGSQFGLTDPENPIVATVTGHERDENDLVLAERAG